MGLHWARFLKIVRSNRRVVGSVTTRTTSGPLGHKLHRGLGDRESSIRPDTVDLLEDGRERAVLVGLAERSGGDGAEAVQELARLAETAGAVVTDVIVQRRARPDPATWVGAGKVEEIRARARIAGAATVIFDHELSPAQQRNLEKALETKVLDRTALVLDIFAQRAHTHEGRLQVELAQMTYLLPRLAGRGVLLSRLGGGIGTRGPGETKLEVDRRRIRTRITDLREEIGALGRHRHQQRQSRRDAAMPVVAIVGYTNAGKSTLLNTLTNAGVYTADKLFATLDPTTRRVLLPNRQPILLVDTVGFIQKLPHDLVAAFRATLEEVTEADVLVHVIDASHPRWMDQRVAVEQVLRELGADGRPTVIALNKADLLVSEALRDVVAEVPAGVPISALRGVGLRNLLRAIARQLPDRLTRVRLLVPHAEGGAIAAVYEGGRVVRREDRAEGVALDAEIPSAMARRLRRYLIESPPRGAR
ncbi:MAG TPA: GTPase HflX [bacterium]|nr:GTPase HflX [bacterium]